MNGDLLLHPKYFDRNIKWINWKKKLDNDLDIRKGFSGSPMSYLMIDKSELSNVISLVDIFDRQQREVLGKPK